MFVLSACVCSSGDLKMESTINSSNNPGEKQRGKSSNSVFSLCQFFFFLKAVKVLENLNKVAPGSGSFCSSSRDLKEILQLWDNRASEFFLLWQMTNGSEGRYLRLRFFKYILPVHKQKWKEHVA